MRRAYIEARCSRAYRVTSDELAAMRALVVDLGERVRVACADKLRELSPNGEVPTLAAVPAITDIVELPDLPDLSDPNSVEAWRDAITQMSYEHGRNEGLHDGIQQGLERGLERGRQEGEQQGLEKGLERGRNEGLNEGIQQGLEKGLERGRHEGLHEGRQEERARAVVEVLSRRGIALTDEQAQRVLACRDETTLTRWWEQAWTMSSADELT